MVRAYRLSLLVLIALGLATACAPSTSKIAYKDIPATGDATHGKVLFSTGVQDAPACASCHSLEIKNVVGPGLAGLAERAAKRVEGKSAREYVFDSITRPGSYIVSGFSNLMYTQYSEKLSAQDIADLTDFVLEPGAAK